MGGMARWIGVIGMVGDGRIVTVAVMEHMVRLFSLMEVMAIRLEIRILSAVTDGVSVPVSAILSIAISLSISIVFLEVTRLVFGVHSVGHSIVILVPSIGMIRPIAAHRVLRRRRVVLVVIAIVVAIIRGVDGIVGFGPIRMVPNHHLTASVVLVIQRVLIVRRRYHPSPRRRHRVFTVGILLHILFLFLHCGRTHHHRRTRARRVRGIAVIGAVGIGVVSRFGSASGVARMVWIV